MEIKLDSTYDEVDRFAELIQRAIRLRARLKTMMPEPVACMRRYLDSLSPGGEFGSRQDLDYILRVLIILAARKMPTMGELTADLSAPMSTTTRLVDWLVATGLVERLPDADDRRIVRISLTEAGWNHYQMGLSLIKQRITYLLTGFTAEERDTLLRLSIRMVDMLENESQDATVFPQTLKD